MDLINKYLSDEQFRIRARDRKNRELAAERDAVALLLQWELLKALAPALGTSQQMSRRSPFSSVGEKEHADLFAESGAMAASFMDYVEQGDDDWNGGKADSPSSPARDSIPHPGERHDG